MKVKFALKSYKFWYRYIMLQLSKNNTGSISVDSGITRTVFQIPHSHNKSYIFAKLDYTWVEKNRKKKRRTLG